LFYIDIYTQLLGLETGSADVLADEARPSGHQPPPHGLSALPASSSCKITGTLSTIRQY